MLERAAALEPIGARTEAKTAGALLPLTVKDLTLEIGEKRLINGIDLKLTVHAVTMVMGPNGAGKSLLLRLLHGLLQPTAGSIRWGGAAISDVVRTPYGAKVYSPPL